MRKWEIVKKGLSRLPAIAGALLLVAVVAHGAVTQFVVPTFATTTAGVLLFGTPAPEIDPGSAVNGVALVFGAMLLLVGMGRKRSAKSMDQQ